MQTVARSQTTARIEVPARFQTLSCGKIKDRFRSIDSPAPDSDALFRDWLERRRQVGRSILDSPYGRALDDEAYQALVNHLVTSANISFIMGPGLITDEIDENNHHPIVTDRAVAVRCPERDCPGHAGWVIEFTFGDSEPDFGNENPYIAFMAKARQAEWPSQWTKLYYVSPRGWVEDEPRIFVPSQRHAKQARRGYADTAGRRRNRLVFDALAAPLQASDMPTEEYDLGRGACLARCPDCQAPRYLQINTEAAAAHLADERCGMLRSN